MAPLRWYQIGVRRIFSRGGGFEDVLFPMLAVTLMFLGLLALIRLRTKEHVAVPKVGHAIMVVAGDVRGEITPEVLAALPAVAAPRGGRRGDWRELTAAIAPWLASAGQRIELRGTDGTTLDATTGRVLLKTNRKGEIRARLWRGEAVAGEITDVETIALYPR